MEHNHRRQQRLRRLCFFPRRVVREIYYNRNNIPHDVIGVLPRIRFHPRLLQIHRLDLDTCDLCTIAIMQSSSSQRTQHNLVCNRRSATFDFNPSDLQFLLHPHSSLKIAFDSSNIDSAKRRHHDLSSYSHPRSSPILVDSTHRRFHTSSSPHIVDSAHRFRNFISVFLPRTDV
ncbi:hypothetical protein ZOSMA_64G00120 [Zostera marina]|uniref:Uncharacterized protein n=1 Tax=Zostera marina TaxID=29655 RepID=A0A0K9NUR6_ZOSMR|nr:hypothetical protein ZOSMA_64G00120 [Zostera marina]